MHCASHAPRAVDPNHAISYTGGTLTLAHQAITFGPLGSHTRSPQTISVPATVTYTVSKGT